MRFVAGLAVAAACVVPAVQTAAATVNFGFARVTPANAALNPAAQFNAAVSDVLGQPTQVTFTFTNTASPTYCSVSEIYYDDRSPQQLLTLHTPLTQQGATFSPGGASPGNLPGGNNLTPAFQAVSAFSADAVGNPVNGLDAPTDFVTMKFDLRAGATFATVIAALNSGTLRLGLHVRAIGGDSDSFVSGGSVIPLPASVWAAGAALAGLAGLRLRRR